MKTTTRLIAASAAAALGLAVASVPAGAAPAYVEGEVVVGLESGGSRVVELPRGTSVRAAATELEREDGVEFAAPNWIARAATALDRGSSGEPGGWREDQWSFLGAPGGIRVAPAWKRLSKATGGVGAGSTTVAVIDTGVAYAAAPGFAAAPDFAPEQFVPGIDLVDDDYAPFDENGHGTHVAATIAEQVTVGDPSKTDDYLTGIAYGARLMPVRVLDRKGAGSAEDVGAGILWAARNGAQVINLSLQFDDVVTSCDDVPTVCDAVRRAKRRGALVIAAAGNNNDPATSGLGAPRALFPGAAPGVTAVGATTEHGCLAKYSHFRKRTDLLAPGGGAPREEAANEECAADSRPILQLSYFCFPLCDDSYERFAIRPDLGTSMAAAHASGVAALVRSAGVLGAGPKPARLARRLACTARSRKPKRFYAPGLLDATKAVRASTRKC